jgi:[ribosomal protein S18]-alanine N-acetyltransferase
LEAFPVCYHDAVPADAKSLFTLRDYDKRDFETLCQLDRLCFEPGIAYSRAELSSFIEQRRAFTIVAEWNRPNANAAAGSGEEQGGIETTARPAIAGFLICHYQKQGYGHIITIDVHPDARRHGVATQLIDAACERLRKRTAFMVVLEVAVNNHAALAFYDRYGFKRIKVLERYYSRDIDAIFMTKRL